jgi:hypothetical protein
MKVTGETYIVEFGNIETNSGLGTFGVRKMVQQQN